ncbi:hypothetical protein BLS_007202 [Venturia inaequalis]|uniref:Secreted protein n=1 Tax=Venturia inaequalis TaxID=5025 RepID=A0A8H3V113_VENIN|nr:hypothetical protein BLS_007202 [Venturia inaequalis]KAE9979960.1 hypothetical protein EG328_000605 [Venturia inaequalis]KAE9980444.1 hypothetical protein EG327_006546 [Venturia inaequalis]
MRFSIISVVLAGASHFHQVFANTDHAAIIAAKELQDQAMFPGHDIFTPSFDLPVVPGNWDKTENYNGTIQHAMQQMDEAHPGWLKEFDAHVAAHSPNASIAKRDEPCKYQQWKADVRCKEEMSGGQWDALHDGFVYLQKLAGKGGMRAGPRACGRISCSYDTAIFTCNDNAYYIEVLWKEAGDGAECIYDKCHYWGGDVERVHGHTFSNKDNWNLIARGLDRDDSNEEDRYC